MDTESIRLTETVVKGGCAAKLPAGQLRQVLSSLTLTPSKELLVGTETMDDACAWDLGDGRLMIQTLDFFTPIVDDPRNFGAIAAANAISDVYAMGGDPKVALTILAFPSARLPFEVLEPLMAGALEKISEAGANLAGGHTIDDDTLKLGFAVTGFVEKKRMWTNAGAQVGDVLILTKGLGTGTITSALKQKKAESSWTEAAIHSMTTLNRCRDLIGDLPIHAATDITGFGLAGHLLQVCRASGVRAQVNLSDLPILEGAIPCLEMSILNKAHHSNLAYVKDDCHFEKASAALKWLTVDPQTSGGLLLSVPESKADLVLASLKSRFPLASAIGRVVEGSPSILFNGET
jgi:selenide,water dikinase